MHRNANADGKEQPVNSEEKEKATVDAGIAGAAAEVVQRYGSAAKEHIIAYEGVDRETGQELAKGLKALAKSKVDPEYEYQNIKQQAGFAAEGKTAPRENAEKIINHDSGSKTVRTDDMQKQPDYKGGSIGGKNETMYDIAEVDKNGVYIAGTGRQLKFVGNDADQCYQKLMSKGYDKYRDADTPMEIPSDFYDDVKAKLAERAKKLEEQIGKAEETGDASLAQKHRGQLERVKKTQKNLKKGKLTNKEAMEARLHPRLSTAKDVTKIAHRGGVEAAKSGAVIGGISSIIRNSVALVKGEKTWDQAALDVSKDTAAAGAVSYGTGFIGTGLKSVMQNARSQAVQAASKTNLPGIVVTVALETGKTMKRYLSGEITGLECLESLGEEGTGMLSSAMFAAVGQAALKSAAGKIIGGLAGGMLEYAVASASYGILVDALEEEKAAHEERVRIEQECQQVIEQLREYRQEIEREAASSLTEYAGTFHAAFDGVKAALMIGDVDGFISSTNAISELFGREPQFHNMAEFEEIMANGDTIQL